MLLISILILFLVVVDELIFFLRGLLKNLKAVLLEYMTQRLSKHPEIFNVSFFFYSKDAVTICTLGIGTAFGESILDNTPRHATIVTREYSELLRIEQKDFKALWEVSSDLFAVNAEKNYLTLKVFVIYHEDIYTISKV